jgi:hypothetical protein
LIAELRRYRITVVVRTRDLDHGHVRAPVRPVAPPQDTLCFVARATQNRSTLPLRLGWFVLIRCRLANTAARNESLSVPSFQSATTLAPGELDVRLEHQGLQKMRRQSSAQQAGEDPVSVEEYPAAITEGDVFEDDMFQNWRETGLSTPDKAQGVASTSALRCRRSQLTDRFRSIVLNSPSKAIFGQQVPKPEQ